MGLASIRLNVPILAGGALFVALGLFLALFMPEHGFRPTPREGHGSWRTLGGTFVSGLRLVRGRPLLATILGLALFHGLSSEGFDRLSQVHFLDDYRLPALGDLKPVVWFGIISASASLLGIGAAEVVKRHLDMADQEAVARLLFGLNVARVAGVIGFGLAASFPLALAAFLVASVARGLNEPLYNAWLNRHVPSDVRATVLSMGGQVDALGQIAGGPVIGAVGTLASLRAALVAAGAVLSPALLLYVRAIRLGREATVQEASVAAET